MKIRQADHSFIPTLLCASVLEVEVIVACCPDTSFLSSCSPQVSGGKQALNKASQQKHTIDTAMGHLCVCTQVPPRSSSMSSLM